MKTSNFTRIAVAAVLLLSPVVGFCADDDGTATATIVAPIDITATQDLAFGKISATGAAGTVVISTAGARSQTGGAVLVSTGSVESQATFDVTGDGNSTYAITLPVGAATITSGGDTMTVDNWTTGQVIRMQPAH